MTRGSPSLLGLWMLVLAAQSSRAGLPARPPAAPIARPDAAKTSSVAYGTVLSAQEQNVIKADELFHDAREAMRRKDYGGAAERLRLLVRLDFPADPTAQELMAGAHASLAEALLLLRSFQEAEDVARRGLLLTGSDRNPTLLRGDVYELLSHISAARGESNRARDYSERAKACRNASAPGR